MSVGRQAGAEAQGEAAVAAAHHVVHDVDEVRRQLALLRCEPRKGWTGLSTKVSRANGARVLPGGGKAEALQRARLQPPQRLVGDIAGQGQFLLPGLMIAPLSSAQHSQRRPHVSPQESARPLDEAKKNTCVARAPRRA